MPIYLKFIEGSKTGELESFEQNQIRFGRQADNDVKFDPQKDVSVSGYHAEIYHDGENFFLKDLQSRNGTYVNSRKIDQPVLLKEGDVVQFSSKGPKLVFSTRDPSQQSRTALLETESAQPTQISAIERPEKADKRPGLWQRMQPALTGVAVIAGLLAFVGIGRYLGFSWWVLLIDAAAILLLVGTAYLGWRVWKRRKALRAQKQAADQEREVSLGRGDPGNIQDLKRKWSDVIRSLRESKLQRSGDDVVYAFPWFMIVGEPGCGKSALIRASGAQSSVTSRGQDGPTRNCDWWFFDKLLVLDTSGRYVFQAKESDSAVEWQELLNLLRNNRRKEPINGVVVALPADSLASKPIDKLKEQAAQIRERLDEMVQRLGVKFPVYLAITKADLITGFSDFFDALPDQVKSQALGQVNPEAINSTDASRFFDRAFRSMCERADRLRLGLLSDADHAGGSKGMFLFPAELKGLQAPLKAFVDVLFRPSPYRDAPFFRGVFLVSARQTGSAISRLSRLLGLNYAHAEPKGTSRDLFARDLFSMVLPNDRGLVGRTALGREPYQLARAAGLIVAIAASLLICGLLTLSFTNNWLAMKRLDLKPCMTDPGSGGAIAQNLRPLDECRQSVEDLTPTSRWKKIAFNFGLGHAGPVAGALMERFVAAFGSGVLSPLDSRIDQSLNDRSGASLVIGAVIQRLQLLGQCQENWKCTDLESGKKVNYRVMLGVAQPQLNEADPAIDRMRRTYEAYLRWQPDASALREMNSKDLQRIRRWVDSGGLSEERILESARAQFSPIQAANFWGVNVPGRVDAAYTARAWREGIAPLMSGLQLIAANASEINDSLKRFEAKYRIQALSQWGEFLGEFPQAEKLAVQSGLGREIALNSGGIDSPYNRVIETAYANLSVILGDGWQGGELQPWAATLKTYITLRTKIAEAQKAGKPASQENAQGKAADAMKYLTLYQSALGQVRAELSTTEKSFSSSKKAFEEGEPSQNATHPILKASWALGMLRDTIGYSQGEDRLLWILLSRPIAVSWKAMLEESGKYLQQQWEGLLLEVKDLDAGPKGGKIIAFVNGSAGVFLSRQGGYWVPRRILDQGVPFSDPFLRYLSLLRRDAISSTTSYPLSSLPSGPQPPAFIVRTS
jgi:type VI secretion system protein ImpL